MVAESIMERHASRSRTSPWYGVGTKGEWTDVVEALSDSDLLFNVTPHHAVVQTTSMPKGIFRTQLVNKQEVPGIRVNMRDDNEEIVGVVSDRYGIVQNIDAFSLMSPFVKEGAVITNAGMTDQGMCFMVARMRSFNVLGDDFDFYVCMTNSFNSRYPLSLFISPLRVICQNMFSHLMSSGNAGMIRIKHGRNSESRIEAAFDACEVTNKMIAEFSKFCFSAKNKELDPDNCLKLLFPYPNADYKGNMDLAKEKADDMREMFMDTYYGAPDNVKYHGTALGFINAYYDYLSHRPEARAGTGRWEDRRLSGLMSGKDVNNKVLKEAMV